MDDAGSREKRRKKAPKPLDSVRLEELALNYIARFSTTASKLERYLVRKIRERGWEDGKPPPVSALVERCVASGYVDDEAYGRMKAGGLLRRGYGERRVRQALGEAGVSEEMRERLAPSDAQARGAALALARRRRFGPFAAAPLDKALREKQLAAMLRAGHPLDSARQIVDAASVAEAEEWAAEADDEEE